MDKPKWGRLGTETLVHPVNQQSAEHMKNRQRQNRALCVSNKNENWMLAKLANTPFKWTRQALWGIRVLDFWCHELGCAVEIDGPDHDHEEDAKIDLWMFLRSAIVVIRVRNQNEDDAMKALSQIGQLSSWGKRRMESETVGAIKGMRGNRKRAFADFLMSGGSAGR